ncbi:MAG: TonB family protein [Candidatus Krumholzibacteriota bacterium]|nr:TonB family protein [Candidatus Krumholzibacteriota bacterium]
MDVLVLSLEMAAIRARTNRVMAVSVFIHLLAALGLILGHSLLPPVPPADDFTEIVILPAVEFQVSTPVAAREAGVEIAADRRALKEITLPPDDGGMAGKRISESLTALRGNVTGNKVLAASVVTPAAIIKPADISAALNRNIVKPAVEMMRGRKEPSPALAGKRREAWRNNPMKTMTPASPIREKSEKAPSLTLPGISLAGPVADRALMDYGIPDYPEWAKRDGVEVSVMLHFVVLPDGRVKESIIVEKTSGFNDFDRNAVRALLAWRFESLGGGATAEQWGRIEFNYKLSERGRGEGS